MLRAGLAGLGMAVATGPLGSFVVWRRMAFFGDAVAHAAILGAALALGLSLPVGLGTFAVALAMGGLLAWLLAQGHSADATLGVLAYSALSIGLVVFSFLQGVRVDIESFLFGDILTTRWVQVGAIWAGTLAVTGLLIWRWSRLLTVTLNPDLASAAGISPAREQAVLTLALALLVALAIKVVGALLIASMLIIPAAAARMLARTPEGMALAASAIAGAAVLAGLTASWHADTPAGPSIVAAAAALYVVAVLAGRFRP